MADNGNFWLDGLYLITKADLNIRTQAKGYLLSIIGPITSTGGSSAWADITGKPAAYPPEAHTHVKADVTDFAHTHVAADVTDLNEGLVGTKDVDETSIADDKILVYDSTSGKLLYEAKPSGGGYFDKLDGTAPPTMGDDTSDGFEIGSTWLDITNKKAYKCFDASSGAAYWVDLTANTGSSLLDRLANYYKLDGDANDAYAYSNGTSTAITYADGNGIINNGAGYNGTTSKIILDNTFGSSRWGFSISMWIKAASQQGYVICTYDASSSNGWSVIIGADNKIGMGYNGGINTLVSSALSTTDFSHVIMMFNGTSSKIFINGTLNASGGAFGTFNNSTSPRRLGGRYTSGTSGDAAMFKGAIDEVGFWERLLMPNEITQLYNSGAGLQYPF